MFTQKCPGQDTRYWTADDVHEESCPNCGEIIEFFKTDIRLRCRNCKTRVANPRFDMGCAEWCAHAEMCLGAGAKGIQKKSFRTILKEEFERLSVKEPGNIKVIEDMITRAEDKCRHENSDMLSVVTAAVILALVKLKLIGEADQYLDQLAEAHDLPPEAIKETKNLIEKLEEYHPAEPEKSEPELEVTDIVKLNIISELFEEFGDQFSS